MKPPYRVPTMKEIHAIPYNGFTAISTFSGGGAIIVVDKFEVTGGYNQTMFQRITHAGKMAMGVSGEEIMQKEFSLIGVQRPLSAIFARRYMKNAPCFFRFGEFAGYVITKQGVCQN